MRINVDYLAEPKLQFGQFFEHEDTKTGLAEYGPFGKSVPGLHRSEIKLGFIGTRETISDALDWITECSGPIESENIRMRSSTSNSDQSLFESENEETRVQTRLSKILNRDFVGFSRSSPFECSFQVNERWNRPIQPRSVAEVLKCEGKAERIRRLAGLFDEEIGNLASTSPSPDIIVIALTKEMVDQAHAARISGNFFLNLRRLIKALSMKWGIPLQLVQHRTTTGKGTDLQEKATRAWNFCTAQYFKAEGIPWRSNVEKDVCFVGISFYVARDVDTKLTIRSSAAQAFDYLGQGLVLRGDPFEWNEDEMGRTPHLTKAAARKLIHDTLNEYVKVNGIPPRRVVIHKSSGYWGADHGEYNEIDGFMEGIEEINPRCYTDLVGLRRANIKLFREGNYPPLRGTYFTVEDKVHLLYTMGFIPYLESYPGTYVPEPWQIIDHHGGSSPKDLFREVLTLTKMNVNNCAFADGTPITLSFSQKIGEIMKHIPEEGIALPQYKFYM